VRRQSSTRPTPAGRLVLSAASSGHNVISLPRLGGLHHRYKVAANNFQLLTRLVPLSVWKGDYAWILAVETLQLVSGTFIVVEDHAIQSAAVQEKASYIENSVTFSFD
jgi:hypothetical protein